MSEVRALLLAAGLGTRLHPLTEHWPKCLMPIGERPLLEYWLETLWRAGMREALVNLHYLPEIVECFLARPRFRDWVRAVKETALLGTAGTLRAHQGNIGAIIKHTTPILINWLSEHEIPYDELHFGKPWCGHDGFYIDDRAVRPREFVENSLEQLHALLERDRMPS